MKSVAFAICLPGEEIPRKVYIFFFPDICCYIVFFLFFFFFLVFFLTIKFTLLPKKQNHAHPSSQNSNVANSINIFEKSFFRYRRSAQSARGLA